MVASNPNIVALEDVDEHVNLLVYGDSGVGKTVFGGSGKNVLILSIEKGTTSAKRQGSKAKVWHIDTWDELTEAYTWLYNNPDHGFDWVVLDSITRMQQDALRAILDGAVEENATRDLDIPAIQDHQKWQNMFKRFILAFCDLPVNTCFLALARKEVDEEGTDFLTPDIQGKGYQISQYVCSLMSAYGYMKIVNKKVKVVKDGEEKIVARRVRRIIFEDTGVVRGKDRFDVLAPYTENKTLAQISAMINGEPDPGPARPPAKKAAAAAARPAKKVGA